MQLASTSDGRASANLEAVVSAAYFQRVDTLFIALDLQHWGMFNAEKNKIQLHDECQPGDGDLLDFAATHTILNDGSVYVLKAEEMFDGAEAAIFRY